MNRPDIPLLLVRNDNLFRSTNGENTGLGRVDDRAEGRDAVHSEVRDGDGTALEGLKGSRQEKKEGPILESQGCTNTHTPTSSDCARCLCAVLGCVHTCALLPKQIDSHGDGTPRCISVPQPNRHRNRHEFFQHFPAVKRGSLLRDLGG